MDKQIPEFSSEDEERDFWSTHDSADYLDWSQAKRAVLPRLKPSTKTISLRLPESMLNELRLLANKRDVPYQSLIKIMLQERIDQELRQRAHFPLEPPEVIPPHHEVARVPHVVRVRLVPPALEVEDHRVRVEVRAIMELDAGAQVEGPGLQVVGDLPPLGQAGDDLGRARLEAHQRLEDLRADHLRLQVALVHAIQPHRIAPAAEDQVILALDRDRVEELLAEGAGLHALDVLAEGDRGAVVDEGHGRNLVVDERIGPVVDRLPRWPDRGSSRPLAAS